jgi:hypothetical protein
LLLEADKFRFVPPQIHLKDLISSLDILKSDYSPYVPAVLDLNAHHINMPASLASLCSYSWDLFVSKAQKIHQSSVWSSFSKKIIEGYQMDLHFVVTDDHYSAYFKQYLLHSPGDAESLSCWRDIRHVLSTLLILKKPPPHSSTTSSSSSSSSSPSSSLNSKKYSSYTPTLASPTSSSSLTSSNPLINYPHPYEPLSILLECLRKYFTLLIRGTCNAITQSTKIKLTALSQQTNSIRTIQSLDLSYAAECCVSIESVLTILMGECYQHLLERYEEYLLSNEYIAAIASIRLRQSEIVQLYLRQNVFLGEVSDIVFCLLLLLLSLSSSSLIVVPSPFHLPCPDWSRQVANGKRFPRRLTGNILFTNYRTEKFLPTKVSLLASSSQSCVSPESASLSESPIPVSESDSSTSTSTSSSSSQRPTLVPCLILCSNYFFQLNDSPPLLDQSLCWLGTRESVDDDAITCRLSHQVIYPENFSATTMSSLFSSLSPPLSSSVLSNDKKKKKRVTFQLDDPSPVTDAPQSNADQDLGANGSSTHRPVELSSLGTFFSIPPLVTSLTSHLF